MWKRKQPDQPVAKPPTYRGEQDNLVDIYTDIGFTLPRDFSTDPRLLNFALFKAYVTAEGSPRDKMPASERTLDYFTNTVYPALDRYAEQNDERFARLGHQVGRTLMAAIRAGVVPSVGEPLKMRADSFEADGHEFDMGPIDNVLEYGMGVTGYVTHAKNLREGNYALTSIEKDRKVNYVIDGMSSFNGGSTRLLHGGIMQGLNVLLNEPEPLSPDLVIASRIHAAGYEVIDGINLSPELLPDGGVLVARGPRSTDNRLGYDHYAKAIYDNDSYEVLVDDRTLTDHLGEPSMLVIAERVS